MEYKPDSEIERFFTEVYEEHLKKNITDTYLRCKYARSLDYALSNIPHRKFRSAICAILGDYQDLSIKIGAALEIAWTGFLVLDDISDESTDRYGSLSAWKKFSIKEAMSSSILLILKTIDEINSLEITQNSKNLYCRCIYDSFKAQTEQIVLSLDDRCNRGHYECISKTKNSIAGICWWITVKEKGSGMDFADKLLKAYEYCALAGQIKNDLYDVCPAMGRAHFNDFENGIVSYPTVELMSEMTEEEKNIFTSKIWKQKEGIEANYIKRLLNKYDIIAKARSSIIENVHKAEKMISELETENHVKNYLMSWIENQFYANLPPIDLGK
jgi:geranylgeranyl pyrophosphate synthase